MHNALEGAASSEHRPTGVAVGTLLLQVVVVTSIVVAVCSLFLGLVTTGKEPPRRAQCMNHAKQLVIASLAYEMTHGRLPLASSQPFSGRPGAGGALHPAGYSWIAHILPYLGKDNVYDRWKEGSQDFSLGPFDTQNLASIPQLQLAELFCPSNRVYVVDTSASEYQEFAESNGRKLAPARSAYIGFSTSHFTNATGLGELFNADSKSSFDGNGAMPFPRTPDDAGPGITLSDIRDGRSYTLMLCESLETAYAAWCDGQAMWAVGAWPGNANVPSAKGGPDGLLGWPDADEQSRCSLGVGDEDDPALAYLPKSRYTAGHDRRWGPSSNHDGGVVVHAFADGYVRVISPDIDRNLYLQLISRDGGEAVVLP